MTQTEKKSTKFNCKTVKLRNKHELRKCFIDLFPSYSNIRSSDAGILDVSEVLSSQIIIILMEEGLLLSPNCHAFCI